MFFTDFSVAARFRELCSEKGDHRENLSLLTDYFHKQGEILNTLRYHLYSHAQFSHHKGSAKEEKERLHAAYDACKEAGELCEMIAIQGRDIHSSIMARSHLPKIASLLDRLETVAETKRHHVAFAISHIKSSVDRYSSHEKDLMEMESRIRGQ